jgi:hypothetical protein
MSALERLGIADNTIVVFTSDNGSERFSDTWPFIGAKTEILEGGMRGIGTKRTGRSGPSCTPPKSSGRWRATCFPDHLNCAMH